MKILTVWGPNGERLRVPCDPEEVEQWIKEAMERLKTEDIRWEYK